MYKRQKDFPFIYKKIHAMKQALPSHPKKIQNQLLEFQLSPYFFMVSHDAYKISTSIVAIIT